MTYDSFSEDYDRFVNWPSRLAYEMPFLTKQLQAARIEAPDRVLDAACGTGMHALELARQGYTAAGADLSAGMITRAKAAANEENLQVPFAASGFGDLQQTFQDLRQTPFDALFCLGNSLPHAYLPGQIALSLVDFCACLRPGGLLLIQNRNFDAVVSKRDRWMEPQTYREEKDEWLFLRFYDFRQDGRINFNILTLRRNEKGDWEQKITTTRLRPLLQAELVQAVETAGFIDVQCYGDMHGAAFDPLVSGNLILAARKKF